MLGVSPVSITMDDARVIDAEMLGRPPDHAAAYLRDAGLLDSALARPRPAASYVSADLVEQTAPLLRGLVHHHPLHDGNKRRAYVISLTFLQATGWDRDRSVDERVARIEAAVTGATTNQIAAVIRERLTPFVGEAERDAP